MLDEHTIDTNEKLEFVVTMVREKLVEVWGAIRANETIKSEKFSETKLGTGRR